MPTGPPFGRPDDRLRIEPQMCNCTSGNLEIPGSRSRAPRNDKLEGANMSDISAVKALVFDVFGTVVDWRTSLIADFTKWSETSGIKADWTALGAGWCGVC